MRHAMRQREKAHKHRLLYHASTKELKVGQKLSYSPRPFKLVPNPMNIEEFLDGYRPDRCPARTSSWFACDSPDAAASFLDAQCEDNFLGKKFIYAIEMDKPSRHPMALVDGVGWARIDNGPAGELAQEYWEPTFNWGFWEYLSPEILVIKSLKWPNVTDFNLGTDLAIVGRYIAKYAGGYSIGNSELPLTFE